jgi:thioredoxin 1
LDEIVGERGGALKVVKFNAGENLQFASRFRITSVPNFLIFKGGQPVGQRIGSVGKRDLLAWIDSAIA